MPWKRGPTFKDAVNEAIRAGLSPRPQVRFQQETYAMGFRPQIAHDRALALTGDLEDDEILRKLALGR